MDSSNRQKINKETETLNKTIDQLDLIVIYRTFHHQHQNTHFYEVYMEQFSRIDYMLVPKTSLSKF